MSRAWKRRLSIVGWGLAGNAAWQLLAQPSGHKLGQLVLSVLVFGSSQVRDESYRLAAMNPVAQAPLILLAWVVGGLSALLGYYGRDVWTKVFETSRIVRRAPGKWEKSDEPSAAEIFAMSKDERTQLVNNARRFTKWIRAAFVALGAVVFVVYARMSVSSLETSQAVLIWQVFHADLEICAPYLSLADASKFEARFASVRTRAQFQSIVTDFKSIASDNHVELRPETDQLW